MGKYGEGDRQWAPSEVRTSYGFGVWKGIRKGWDQFRRYISFDIGNGETVRFWDDKWCGDIELRRALPGLYNIAINKEEKVSSVMQRNGDVTVWNPAIRRV